jgi:ABC-type Mn2+/Zn2+ transport system ATPase subunit
MQSVMTNSDLALCSVQGLSVHRGTSLVLEDLNFQLNRGSLCGLTGPNGGGKSTLFEVLMGWRSISSGSLEWKNNASISLLPQVSDQPQNLPITVKDFVAMGTWGRKSQSKPALDLDACLSLLSLETIQKKLVRELSGGEWKRACLARCLVQPADVYLLDEPFNHLDISSEERVGHLLQDLRLKGKTFFVISHDWHAMNHFMDSLILLNRRILSQGSVAEVTQNYRDRLDPRHHEWMHLPS